MEGMNAPRHNRCLTHGRRKTFEKYSIDYSARGVLYISGACGLRSTIINHRIYFFFFSIWNIPLWAIHFRHSHEHQCSWLLSLVDIYFSESFHSVLSFHLLLIAVRYLLSYLHLMGLRSFQMVQYWTFTVWMKVVPRAWSVRYRTWWVVCSRDYFMHLNCIILLWSLYEIHLYFLWAFFISDIDGVCSMHYAVVHIAHMLPRMK